MTEDPTKSWPTVTAVIEHARSGADHYARKAKEGDDYVPLRFYAIPEAALEIGTRRGRDIHMACADLVAGEPDYWTEDAEIGPYVAQFQAFLAQAKVEVHATEERCRNAIHEYRGRLDYRLTLNGSEDERCVLDLKSGQPSVFDQIQTQAYRSCYAEALRRYALYVTPTRYRLIEHRSPHDYAGWVAMLQFYKWGKLTLKGKSL